MNVVPDTGLFPVSESPVGGSAGAAEFERHVLPATARGENKPDDADGNFVWDTGSTAVRPDGLLGRKVMDDGLIEPGR
jgi:hypothetical protein